MCIIIDASLASRVFASPTPPDFQPIFKWIDERDGKMVFGGKNAEELGRVVEAGRRILELDRRGKIVKQPKARVDQETETVKSLNLCKSSDQHIVALARVSGARVLCSADKDLHADFTNPRLVPKPRGKVYQNASHSKVLGHCSSCRANLTSAK